MNYILSGKKVSIVDVARVTGLSRSTVDRVLNGRPGVRAETRSKVEAALKTLGYAPSALSSWRSRQSKSLCVLAPEGTNPFFSQIRKGIEMATKRLPPDYVDVHFEPFNPYEPASVQNILQNLKPGVNAVITVGADSPEVEAEIQALEAKGVRVITVVSDVPNSHRTTYIGQDNFVAGRTAGRLMIEAIGPKPGKVAAMLGHLQYRHLLDRQSGFQQVIGLERPDLDLITTKPYGMAQGTAREIVAKLLYDHDDLKGVYLAGGGQPYLIEEFSALAKNSVVTIGHELTQPTRKALRSGAMKFLLAHDIYEIGRRAIDAVFDENPSDTGHCEVKIYVAENLPSEN